MNNKDTLEKILASHRMTNSLLWWLIVLVTWVLMAILFPTVPGSVIGAFRDWMAS